MRPTRFCLALTVALGACGAPSSGPDVAPRDAPDVVATDDLPALDDVATDDTPTPDDAAFDAPATDDVASTDDVPATDDAAFDAPATDDVPPDAPRAVIVNPVIARSFPDPSLLLVGSTYHVYATGPNIPHATSTDLQHWGATSGAMPSLAPWIDTTDPQTWAPGVIAVSSTRFVMFYTAHLAGTAGRHCLGRAIASSADGPFRDTMTAPLYCDPTPGTTLWSLDPYPMRARGGNLYLYWRQDASGGQNTVAVRALDATGAAFATGSSVTTLIQRTATWESSIIENPAMTTGPGSGYLLFYSGNLWQTANYAIGYATCSSPTGPCTKQTTSGPWLASRDGMQGPGGESFFVDTNGDPWMSLHAWAMGHVASGNPRQVWVGRFDGAGARPSVTLVGNLAP